MARPPRLPQLHHPVVMHAYVGREDRVFRDHAGQASHQALGTKRRLVALGKRGLVFVPRRLALAQLRRPIFESLGHRLELFLRAPGHHLETRADVAHDAEVDGVIASDLRRIVVDLDQLRGRYGQRIAADPRARGAVVEAAAEREQDIGVARGFVGGIGPVSADCAERELVGLGYGALAVGAGHHGYAHELEELEQRVRDFADQAALSDQNHRATRGEQQLERPVYRPQFAGEALVHARIGIGDLDFGRFLENIERHVDVHRSGAAAAQEAECLLDRERQHFHARRLKALLHQGADDRREIALEIAAGFLERHAVELGGGHVAGDREKRGRIHHGPRERDRKIARSRSARGVGRHRLMADLVVGIGHVARRLLVMHRDRLDAGGGIGRGVEKPDIAVPAHAEQVRDFLLDQVFDQDLRALPGFAFRRSARRRLALRRDLPDDRAGHIHGRSPSNDLSLSERFYRYRFATIQSAMQSIPTCRLSACA